MKSILLASLLVIAGVSHADPTTLASTNSNIPTSEKEFLDHMEGADKTKVLAQFGQPSNSDDLVADSGKVIASVWHYHNLNTDDKGAVYQTTELDFVGDKVVMIVFMNNDGTAPEPSNSEEPQNEAPASEVSSSMSDI